MRKFRLLARKKISYGLCSLLIILTNLIGIIPERSYAQSVVSPPTFSVVHGHFAAPFQLTLTSATPDAQIRYTTDFSTPTPTQGTVYSGALTVDKTSVVRAIAYTSDSNQSATVTQTYIFLAQVRNQSNNPGGGWPTVFAPKNTDGGPYPAYYEMAPEIVNHASNSSQVEAALLALPSLSVVTDQPNLWDADDGIYINSNEKGKAWERPISIELISPDAGTTGFSLNAGVRIHGQGSRRPHRTPKKSLRIYFRGGDYGVPKLDYKLFDDNDAVSQFDRILLRNGGNRSFPYFDRDQRREADYINDEFARRTFLGMDGLAGHGTYAHLYLNGQYWGLYNVTERMDDTFLIAYLGGTSSDYDLISPDEDQNYQPAADPGTLDAWNALHDLLNVETVDHARYQQVQQQLDVVDLADYMVLLHYVANTDWPAHNWYTYRKRSGADTRFRMIPWDSDTALNQINENVTLRDAESTPARLFHKLMTNADFRQLVADRFYRHLIQSQGLLTPTACAQQYGELANIVDLAIIGESARWGAYAQKIYPQMSFTTPNKALPAYFHSRSMPAADSDPDNDAELAQRKNWVQVRDAKLNNYCPQRTGVVINQYIANGWYQTAVNPPTFSQNGGAVAQNDMVTIDNSVNNGDGAIYYTVDGVDPRQAGGAVADSALDGGDLATVTISQVATVRARVLANGVWSPLQEATFYPPQPLSNLVINEIHYHPTAPVDVDGDVFEFIELYNKGTVPLRLDNAYFSRGFTYHFPPETTLAAGAYFVLSPDAQQFKERYGFDPDAVLRGNLANSGEAIELRDAVGNVIDLVDYLDVAPWPLSPDGAGPSLSLLNPALDNALADSWAPSPADHGTPGQPNGLTVINQAPQVHITSPAPNTHFTVGTAVTITAEATDPDGAIQQVVFLANDTLLCTVTTAPYQCTFTPAVGTFTLTVQATDTSNAMTTATAVPIMVDPVVSPPQPPTVRIISPAPNATFAHTTTVTIEAEASDSDGVIQQVAFLLDNSVVCTDTVAPYTCTVTPPPGAHTVNARATDSQGLTATTEAITIMVEADSGGQTAATLYLPLITR
ncbi:MAG: Ig-like domain-containing protein [Caldilineaceae bacterium]